VAIAELAPETPLPAVPVRRAEAWKGDYPWLHEALRQIGPRAQSASDDWRARIEDELKTTLDFMSRADGTAVVWCGMSGYDFRHDPTPKELFEGLARAYQQERKRLADSNRRKNGAAHAAALERPKPQPLRDLPRRVEESLARALGSVLLLHTEQLLVVVVVVLTLTFTLSALAIAVR
jgi:hypothetical protein